MPEQVTAAIIGLIAGALSGFAAAVITNQFERRREIDESVREVRKGAYAKLWNGTSLLPMWPRATVAAGQLLALSEWLRAWYFGGYGSPMKADDFGTGDDASGQPGGMYLSQEARAAYTEVQEAIKDVLEAYAGGVSKADSANRNLSDKEYEKVRLACSRLRTELTADLLSRKRAFLVG